MARDAGPEDAALEKLVFAERVRALYSRGPLPFVTNVVNSSVLAYLLWVPGEAAIIRTWLGANYAVTIARVVLWRAYWRFAPGPADASRWGSVLTAGIALNGAVWGASAVAFYPAGSVTLQAVMLLVLGGMSAGAAVSTGTLLRAFVAFVVPALAPISIRLFLEGDEIHVGLAVMAVLFGVAMSRVARAGERMLVESERLRLRNDSLVDDLREARARLTAANVDLEHRVAARTSELLATLDRQTAIEAALRRQKEILQKIFDFAPVMLVLYDAGGRIEMLNREFERLLGWPLEDLASTDATSRLFPDPAEERAMREHQREGSQAWRDFVCCTRDGRALFTSWAHVRLSDGLAIGIGQDITERRRARDALVLSARMASVGTLAAGVAHEINNPLAFVLSNLEFTASVLRSTAEEVARGVVGEEIVARIRESIDAMDDAHVGAERVRNIVRDLKTFSRGVDDRGTPVKLIDLLETAIRMADNELRHRARVVREFGPVPPFVGQGDRLGQVFLNLLVNAAHAIKEGDAAGNEVRIVAATQPDGRALVEVRDTGSGISRDVLPRILDPFFTTKPVGQGTGLGLSICHGIVTGLGGQLQVESELGRGTVVRVLLPPTQAPLTPSEPPPFAPAASGHARVLVIDDEPRFGRAVQRMIGASHEVSFEADAQGALDRLAAGEQFDVILCDLMMPDVTGMDFFERLSEKSPLLAERVAFTTGGAFTSAAREFLRRSPTHHLAKPFAKHDLDALLEIMLRRKR